MKKYIQTIILAILAFYSTFFSATAQQWSYYGSEIYTNATAVGIGTIPDAKLDVYGNNVAILLGNTNSTNSALRLLGSNSDDYAYIQAGISSSDNSAKLKITRFKTSDQKLADFRVYSEMVGFFGQVGIGTATPSYKLDVNGITRSTGGFTTSDKRFKSNIQPIEGSLNKIMALRGTTYTFRTAEFRDIEFPSGGQLGFIAQEVKEVLPELVSEDNNGYFSVNYDGLIPVLVEAMKEQQAQIKEKDATIQNLETKVSELENRLTKIEQLLANQSTGERSINIEQEQDFAVFPNPTKDAINIVFNLKMDSEVSISIMDASGKFVRQSVLGRLTTGEHSAIIDLSQLPNGNYFVCAMLKGKQVTKKIVVQR